MAVAISDFSVYHGIFLVCAQIKKFHSEKAFTDKNISFNALLEEV